MTDLECVHDRLITTFQSQTCRDCGLARSLPDGPWRSQRRAWPAWAIEVRVGGPRIDVCPDCDHPMDHTYGQRRRCPLCGLVWRRPTRPMR